MPETLTTVIARKEALLGETVHIADPAIIPAGIAGPALVDTLSSMYGTHNLTQKPEEATLDIIKGKLIPWLMVDKGGDIQACAALVKQSDCFEIGRVANGPDGKNGSLIVLKAVEWHLKNNHPLPLVAEIRLSDDSMGIRGGQPIQHTLLHHVGMNPDSIIPAFHHPGPNGPDRQEFFCFASLMPESPAPSEVFLPKDIASNLSAKNMLSLWPHLSIKGSDSQGKQHNFKSNFNGIFHTLTENPNGISLAEAEQEIRDDDEFKFVLTQVPATEDNLSIQSELARQGHTFLGFTPAFQDAACLWGKVSKNIPLSPMGLASTLNKTFVDFANITQQSIRGNLL